MYDNEHRRFHWRATSETEKRMEYLPILFVAAIVALIPAAIASSKNRSFGGFWLYGFLLFPIALIHACIMEESVAPDSTVRHGIITGRKCPFCAEIIKLDAIVCRFCGRNVPKDEDSIARNAEYIEQLKVRLL
jgi:hypothetical protein